MTITTAFRAKHRVRAFKKWVKVAWKLRLLYNFEFMFVVMQALQSEYVRGYKPDWESAERTCGYFEDMMRLTETQADPYREALAQARAPCIPILEPLLRGLGGGHTWYDELRPSPHDVLFAVWRRRRPHLALLARVKSGSPAAANVETSQLVSRLLARQY